MYIIKHGTLYTIYNKLGAIHKGRPQIFAHFFYPPPPNVRICPMFF